MCRFRCSTLSLLKKHRKTHSPEKPFACDKCTYRTRTAYSLRTHAATHTTDKPFSCDKCSFTCKLLPRYSFLLDYVSDCENRR